MGFLPQIIAFFTDAVNQIKPNYKSITTGLLTTKVSENEAREVTHPSQGKKVL